MSIVTTILVELSKSDYMKTLSDLAREIDSELAQVINCSRLTLVGHSFGCLIAVELARQNPSRYSRLLLLEPTIKCPEYYRICDFKIKPVAKRRISPTSDQYFLRTCQILNNCLWESFCGYM